MMGNGAFDACHLNDIYNNNNNNKSSSLFYTDTVDEDDIMMETASDLCGTMRGLDLECIPVEAHAMARFYLASHHHHHEHGHGQSTPINIVKKQTCSRRRAAALMLMLLLRLLHHPVGSLPVWVNSRKLEHQPRHQQSTTTTTTSFSNDRRALENHVRHNQWTFLIEYTRATMV
mmetsp:Transcript_250/g.343  ORF Transcript_250/g.343 Transcript_250/m.343 type:complete len:174 (-) Transcript_250:23-544(-)